MSFDQTYTEVREICDNPNETTRFIDGGGWDLLDIANRKREIAKDVYSDQVVYVIGHRADAQ